MKSIQEQLISTIIAGEPNEVKALLEAKASVDAQDVSTGLTPLMYAVRYPSSEIMALLCEKKPNKELKDHRGKTVFDHCQTLARKQPALKALLEKILNSDMQDVSHEARLAYTALADEQQKTRELQQQLREAKMRQSQQIPEEPIKIKAFRDLIEDGLLEVFFVAKAVEDGKVQASADSVEKVIDVIRTAAPNIESGLKIHGLGIGINAAAMLIQIYRNKRKQAQASHLVGAFANDLRNTMDKSKLKKVSLLLANRYEFQILQLQISTKWENGSEVPNPRPGDSIAILAKGIIGRIVYSIVSGDNRYQPTPYFSKREQIPISIEDRCILATLVKTDNEEDEKAVLATEAHSATPWTVSGLLDFSGIKVKISEHRFALYTKRNTDAQKYGFYLAHKEEADRLGFSLLPPIFEPQPPPKQNPFAAGLFGQSQLPAPHYQSIQDSEPQNNECCQCSCAIL